MKNGSPNKRNLKANVVFVLPDLGQVSVAEEGGSCQSQAAGPINPLGA